jgi:hypothetical protein
MSTNFKSLLTLTAVGVFFVSTTAMADFRDYNYKAWNSIYLREHAAANNRVYRAAAPMIVRSQAAPAQVAQAQAPANERASSYEPDTKTDTAQATPKVATRSFSYEPGATYSAPVLRGGGRASGSNSYETAMRAKGY